MVKVRCILALAWLLGACASETDPLPVLRFDRPVAACSKLDECLTQNTEFRELPGIHLIHKRTPHDPLVAIRIMIEPGAARTSSRSVHAEGMLLELIRWWGSQSFGPTWTHDLADIGAQLSTGAGADYSQVSMILPRAHFERGFSLLAAAVNRPPIESIGEDDFESIKAGFAARARAQADDVDTAAAWTAWSLFAPGHPYSSSMEHQNTIAQVMVSDLADVHQRLRTGFPLTVIVVGDVPLDEVVDQVQSSLEAEVRPRTPPAPPQFVADPLLRMKQVVRPDAPASHVYGLFRAPPPATDDYAALELGLRVLTSRLLQELRTKRGIVYEIRVGVSNYRVNFGYLTLSTTELPTAMAAFREILQGMVRDGIDPAELDAERAQLLTESYASAHSVDSLSWLLGDWQMTSGDWKLAAAHSRRVQAVEASEATEAVRRYVDDLHYGVAGPKGDFSEEQITGREPNPCIAEPNVCGCPGYVPFEESCNGKDDDCNGRIDEDWDWMAPVDEPVRQACGVCWMFFTTESCPGHTVFVSSAMFDASLGGVAGADAKCGELAAKAGRSGTWRAILTEANKALSGRIHITRPVYNTQKVLVASRESDFFNSGLLDTINLDERGAPVAAPEAWFGRDADCADWTSTSRNEQGSTVLLPIRSSGWTAARSWVQCDVEARLYCIDQDL
ncbi:MAG TPA: insulinase family protein [Polyangiales bacterium]|nr:insulinase family protein [Polyangiales bacterium]